MFQTRYMVCYREESSNGGFRIRYKEVLDRSIEAAAIFIKHMVGTHRFQLNYAMKADTFKTDQMAQFQKEHGCQGYCFACSASYEDLFQSGK